MRQTWVKRMLNIIQREHKEGENGGGKQIKTKQKKKRILS